MNDHSPATAISPLRQRLIDDMNMRRSRARRSATTCDVGRFATFLRRSPDTATADDAPVPDRAARCRCADADDEQHRLGVAVLLHTYDRSA